MKFMQLSNSSLSDFYVQELQENSLIYKNQNPRDPNRYIIPKKDKLVIEIIENNKGFRNLKFQNKQINSKKIIVSTFQGSHYNMNFWRTYWLKGPKNAKIPKLANNDTKNGLKMIQKTVEKWSKKTVQKTVHKWSQKRSKYVPKAVHNGPKTVQNGQKTVNK